MHNEELPGAALQPRPRNPHTWGFAESKIVVFRLIRPPPHERTGHTRFRKCQKLGAAYVIAGDGPLPISCGRGARAEDTDAWYNHRASQGSILAVTREHESRPLPHGRYDEGATRRLWKNGALTEVRMAMGCRKTPDRELEYLEMELEKQLGF